MTDYEQVEGKQQHGLQGALTSFKGQLCSDLLKQVDDRNSKEQGL